MLQGQSGLCGYQAGFLSPRVGKDVVSKGMGGIDVTCSIFTATMMRGKQTAQVVSKIPS